MCNRFAMRGGIVAALLCTAFAGGSERTPREKQAAAHAAVAEGNRAVAAQDYDAALKAYARAEDAIGETPVLRFNQGVVYYRQGDYAKAAAEFAAARTPTDPLLDARTQFNQGNCAYADALTKREQDSQAAMEALGQALEFYRGAAAGLPRDPAPRENIERASRLLEQLKEQQAQQQQQQQNDKDQEKQDQQQQQQNQPQDGPQNQEKQQEKSGQDQQSERQQKDQSSSNQQEQGQSSQDRQQQVQDDQDQQQQDREQEQQQQPSGEEQQQQQQNGQQGQQQQQARDQQSQGQQQQDQQPQAGEDQQQEQPQAGPQQDGELKEADPPEQPQAEEGAPGNAKAQALPKMTGDEVRRLLQMIRDKERQRRQELARQEQARTRQSPVKKDW